jgi:hypothetical protein
VTESFVNLIEDYFTRFGDKACCYDDLKRYLLSLDPSERQELVQSSVLEVSLGNKV